MNTDLARRDVLDSLKADPEYRHAWNLENVYTTVCFQIRALREQRGLTQATLGQSVKMAQERISILEDPNSETKPTLNTLLRIADGFDVGLEVRFIPYGAVIERSIHTNMKELEVPSFADELPALEARAAAIAPRKRAASANSNLARDIMFHVDSKSESHNGESQATARGSPVGATSVSGLGVGDSLFIATSKATREPALLFVPGNNRPGSNRQDAIIEIPSFQKNTPESITNGIADSSAIAS